jgi:hypothetical protein
MSPAAQQQGISLASASQGGLIDDIDVTVLDAAFVQWDYNGNIDHEVLALGIQYQDGDGKTYDQYYSAGELNYLVPSEDGSRAIPVSDKSQLSDSCNAWKFIASLIECGFPIDKLETGDIKAIVGMQCHVKQHAQPKRQGLIRGGKNPDREPTVLLVSAILAMPGEGQAAAPAKKAAQAPAGRPTQAGQAARPGLGKPAQAAAAKPGTRPQTAAAKTASPSKPNGQAGPSTTVVSDDDKAIAEEIVTEILVESGGSITKKEMATASFRKAGEKVAAGTLDAKNKTKMVQLVFMDSFLHELAEKGTVVFDGSKVEFPA